jgi:mannosyl-oligosaccharide alpha-1,2-mannosidase
MVSLKRRWRLLIIAAATFLFWTFFLRSPHLKREVVVETKVSPPTTIASSGKQHWSKIPENYPVRSLTPLPTERPISIPQIQAYAKIEDATKKSQRLERQAAVKASFKHSWDGYKKHAWLRDEVIPVEGGYRDTFGGWAATLVDSLDTLWIMGMEQEFEQAVKALNQIDFTTTETTYINVFETTIRYLGGLLAAYDISEHKYSLLLQKATEVADLLMGCFDTPNRLPVTRWDWKR